jgi:UDP-glucuronate decarboxylase
MHVLVAGGAGFIGSHLCERLLQEGHSVVSIDNCYTGSYKNIFHLVQNPNFKSVPHNVIYPFNWSERFDFIFHLASPASPKWYQADPIGTIKANILGSFNLLDRARSDSCPIFYSSTSEVYGDPKEHPQKESYFGNVNCTGPRANYDESKRCSETIFFEYQNVYGIDVKVARFFNTFGPRMASDDGRVVSNFIVNALKGNDITIHGDGKQTRSFQYISDLINALIKFMNSKSHGPINLGNPEEFTILDLANLVISKTNSKSKIVFKDKLQDDPVLRCPDINKAKQELNWEPKVKLSEGLDYTIDYFKSIS